MPGRAEPDVRALGVAFSEDAAVIAEGGLDHDLSPGRQRFRFE
jgi:hypothetical protein